MEKGESFDKRRARKISWFIMLFPLFVFVFGGGIAFFARLLSDFIFTK